MRIDSLTHVTADCKWFGTGHDASLGRLQQEMEAAGLDRAVLSGVPGLNDHDFVLRIAANSQKRLIPVAAWQPASPENAESQAEQLVRAGFQGIKLHPRMMGLSLLSEEMFAALEAAGKCGLAAFICTIHRPPMMPLGRPLHDALHELCASAMDTRIILLHGGYSDLLATSEVVRPMEHVLLDLSFTLTRFREASLSMDARYLLRNFDRRVCLGSDFPEYVFTDVLKVVQELGFSEKELELNGILGDNLSRYLYLS